MMEFIKWYLPLVRTKITLFTTILKNYKSIFEHVQKDQKKNTDTNLKKY